MNVIAIRAALLGAAIAAPLTGAAMVWLADPPKPAPVRVIFETKTPRATGIVNEPQFDSGDRNFIIDPDESDIQSPARSCFPGDDDCGDEPDETTDRILHT